MQREFILDEKKTRTVKESYDAYDKRMMKDREMMRVLFIGTQFYFLVPQEQVKGIVVVW